VIAGAVSGTSAAETPKIPLAKGLVLTTTTHAGLSTTEGSLSIADMETVYSVDEVAADQVFWLSRAAGRPEGCRDAEEMPRYTRIVRTEDLRTAARLNTLFSSADPAFRPDLPTKLGGALTSLKSSGETPFVFGINESDEARGGLASMLGGAARSAPGSTAAGTPLDVSGLISSLGTARHYYRGTLKRVEPGIVKFSVLLNGARTEVPAVHARGLLKFSDQQLETDFWWLDDPANPLTLKWSAGKGTYAVLTRIDLPESAPATAAAAGGTVAARLADKSCRAELHGIYFESGSAELLVESEPALRLVASALNANPGWQITVEGHGQHRLGGVQQAVAAARRCRPLRPRGPLSRGREPLPKASDCRSPSRRTRHPRAAHATGASNLLANAHRQGDTMKPGSQCTGWSASRLALASLAMVLLIACSKKATDETDDGTVAAADSGGASTADAGRDPCSLLESKDVEAALGAGLAGPPYRFNRSNDRWGPLPSGDVPGARITISSRSRSMGRRRRR
jgi:hypothetical protein